MDKAFTLIMVAATIAFPIWLCNRHDRRTRKAASQSRVVPIVVRVESVPLDEHGFVRTDTIETNFGAF